MLKRIKMHKFYTETYWHDADVVVNVPDDAEEGEVRERLRAFRGGRRYLPLRVRRPDLEIDDVLDAPRGPSPSCSSASSGASGARRITSWP